MIASLFVLLAVEFLNTAIEKFSDHVTPEHHKVIGRIKDYGSAAVFSAICLAGLVWLAALATLRSDMRYGSLSVQFVFRARRYLIRPDRAGLDHSGSGIVRSRPLSVAAKRVTGLLIIYSPPGAHPRYRGLRRQ